MLLPNDARYDAAMKRTHIAVALVLCGVGVTTPFLLVNNAQAELMSGWSCPSNPLLECDVTESPTLYTLSGTVGRSPDTADFDVTWRLTNDNPYEGFICADVSPPGGGPVCQAFSDNASVEIDPDCSSISCALAFDTGPQAACSKTVECPDNSVCHCELNGLFTACGKMKGDGGCWAVQLIPPDVSSCGC